MAHSGFLNITEKLREDAELILSLCDAARCAESIKDKSVELRKIIEATNDLEKKLSSFKLQADPLLQDLKLPQEELNSALRNTVELFPQIEISVGILCNDGHVFATLVKKIYNEQKQSAVIPDMSEIRRSLRKVFENTKTLAITCKELCERQQKAQLRANAFAQKMRKKQEELLAAKTPTATLVLDTLKTIGYVLSGGGILAVGHVTRVSKLRDLGVGLIHDGVDEGERFRDKVNRNRELTKLAEAMSLEASKMGVFAKSLEDNENRLAAFLNSSDNTMALELALKLLDRNLKAQSELADKDAQIASLIEAIKLHGVPIPSHPNRAFGDGRK